MIAKYKKNILVRRLITILAVVASALLQTYVIQAFIRPANLLSSGFTGVAILIDRIASLYGHNISTSLGMLVLNIPVAILCSRSISMRFTFYSMLQVFLASFFLKICSFQPCSMTCCWMWFRRFSVRAVHCHCLKGKCLHRRHGLHCPVCFQ